MQVVTTVPELRAIPRGEGKRVLVPTMGALHEGHMKLLERARSVAGNDGTVVISIFVNPIQFDRANDLETYPRPVADDLDKCKRAGVDVVFMPEADTMYAADHSVTVSESLLSCGLCGASRPGHFDGVCTVVLKLFLASACHAAVFGEKDFQQLAIIRRMVRDLDVPVEIVGVETMREADGLAMSSRNGRLSREQRADAPRIYRALCRAAELRQVGELLNLARGEIESSAMARIDYLCVVDAETLQPVENLKRPTILAVAVFYGEVRLIDHVVIPCA